MKTNSITIFFKNNYKVILVGLLVLFLLYWMIFILTPLTKMNEESRFEIRELDKKIEEVQKKQEVLQTEIEKYEQKIEETNYNLKQIKQIKINVGNEYGKKINSVTNYTNTELDKFFTERYSKK